jgi:copper/silver efflux system protein
VERFVSDFQLRPKSTGMEIQQVRFSPGLNPQIFDRLFELDGDRGSPAAVGFIALAGVAAETGVVMLTYLEHAYVELQEQRTIEGQPFSRDDLYSAIMSGAVERVRPKMMTVCAIMAGLLPIMWSHGTGAEVMQRIAVPMIGGMVSSTLLTLIVIPAIYAVVKGIAIRSPRLAPSLQQT